MWLVSVILPLGFPLVVGLLVSRVPPAVSKGFDSPEGRNLFAAVGILAAILILQRLIDPLQQLVTLYVTQRIDSALKERTLSATTAPIGVSHLDDAAMIEEVAKAEAQNGQVAVAVPQVFGRYVTAIGALLIVAHVSR